MKEKFYFHGLFVGKFQPITKAQKNIIEILYHLCQRVSIVVETKENDYEYCLSNVEKIYFPLEEFITDLMPDRNYSNYGDIKIFYSCLSKNPDKAERLACVQQSLDRHNGLTLSQFIKPDVVAYGNDETEFYHDPYFTDMTHLRFNRDQNPMSGTEVRNMILLDLVFMIEKYTEWNFSFDHNEVKEEMLKYPEARKVLEDVEVLNLINESKNTEVHLQAQTIKLFRECTGIGLVESRKYLTLHNWNVMEALKDVKENYNPIRSI